MEKTAKAELIAALVTDKYSGFKTGDEPFLDALSDVRLEEFRAASEVHKATAATIVRMETEARNTSARLKVAEDRLLKAEQPMTEEEFAARAPAGIKSVLEARAAEENALKGSLVNALKNVGGETEEELKKKTIPELQTLARYARVQVLDYSGRGVAQQRAASSETTVDYTPPDPFAAGLKEKRELETARR